MSRTVRPGQLYRDLAPDMRERDRRLRVTRIGEDQRAECVVEHDLGGAIGRIARIQVRALASPAKYELLENSNTLDEDPRFTALLAAMAAVHGRTATPRDYAWAAWEALGLTATAPEEATT